MKRNDILLILIPSFIFALAWIGFSIYHNVITSTISEPLSVQITPITPTFDTQTIDSLKNRENVAPLYDLSTAAENVSPTPVPTAPVIIAPVAPATTSGVIQQASPEGSLTQ
jgi:hypothetical protein